MKWKTAFWLGSILMLAEAFVASLFFTKLWPFLIGAAIGSTGWYVLIKKD